MLHPVVATAVATVFQEKTGVEWGNLKPGDRGLPGKYWVQQQANPDLTAKWQYYVHDGVDGKRPGWYDYDVAATGEVEEIYAQHVANACESRTRTRVVSSGYFKYEVDLASMTQKNTRTRKVRTIRRSMGGEEQSMQDSARHVMKTMKRSTATVPMKAMKRTDMKLSTKSMKG